MFKDVKEFKHQNTTKRKMLPMSRKQQLRFLSFIVLILKILNADFTGRIAAAAAAPARRVAFKLRAKKKVHQKLRNPQITAGNLEKAQRGPGRCVQSRKHRAPFEAKDLYPENIRGASQIVAS